MNQTFLSNHIDILIYIYIYIERERERKLHKIILNFIFKKIE